jgi:hypothetical protein
MRDYPPEILTALASRRLRARRLLDLTVRDRDTGDPVRVGFWSGLKNVTAPVIDPETGDEDELTWYGAGALIQIDDIPATVGITVTPVNIRMSQLDAQVNEAVRLYDTKQAVVKIYLTLFDPVTALAIAPGESMFYGYVDDVKIVTPKEGGTGYVDLTCKSHTQELLRGNPSTRSHADQQLRHAGDDFFKDTSTIADWGPVQWGPMQAKVDSEKQGLFGWGGKFLGL